MLECENVTTVQKVVVSAIRSRATEANLRRKASLSTGNFFWVFTSTTGEVFTTPEALKQTKDNNGECSGDDDDNEREEFLSVQSYFSHSSSARSRDEFFSIKTNINLLRSRSLSGLDFPDFRRRSIIHKLRHCEGWPFGLCRKALLLPPLPKSPTESWSWRKGSRII
ncbi:uncharacterized protein LOC131162827 isoform X2 [Malania oleifera]|uniref:uncharacterized protein LOC131162827 isoform X2 n=1 Tax=Malania oleifera TaxID=397392 RepID=UPI0025AE893D|nr:uncharacterized protein LOC131162827 isoform X2 [Malania oleifera]XP_057975412.1 uncharacterized protein LOC131162827 isoform X2 [Malania oleifera]